MKKHSLKRMLISWGLFISLMIPMLLDGLHYVIFQHHNEEAQHGLEFQNTENSHILCSYPFVTEELAQSAIGIAPFEQIIKSFYTAETHRLEGAIYFPNQLRAPPIQA